MAELLKGEEGDNLILSSGCFSSSPPRPDKQDEEYDIENTERFPDPCLQISGGPMPQDDAAVGNLEQDAIGDEVTVPDRVAGDRGIHQGEDKEQGRGELDIAVMIGLCDFRHEFLKNKIAGKRFDSRRIQTISGRMDHTRRPTRTNHVFHYLLHLFLAFAVK